jgi:hypothetical protein
MVRRVRSEAGRIGMHVQVAIARGHGLVLCVVPVDRRRAPLESHSSIKSVRIDGAIESG